MASISESREHRSIHDVNERLTENARMICNQDFSGDLLKHPDLKRIVRKDIADMWDDPREFVVEKVREHARGTITRLLTHSLTRGERKKVREMATHRQQG